ncbi:hypothetical protein GCM10010434_084280 [Winogradskya humida]
MDVEMGATGGRTPPSKLTVALLGTSVLAVVWALMMMIPAGRVAYVYIFSYSEFYMGVLTLVSLSITIMVGLVSTDRLVLSIRQRLLLQSTHRTTGTIAVVSLFIHIWTKYAMGKMQFIDAFIPFLNPGKPLFIGFGTISGWIMVLVMWTGFARAKFIGRGKPWMWRALHSVSYLMWPIAILHGLNAGRPGATFVVVGYVLCVLVVLIGLAVRIAVSLNRRKDFASQQGTAGGGGTGGMSPVGKMGSSGVIGGKGRGRARGGDDAIVSDRGNAVQTWKPATPRPAAGATSEQPVIKPAAAEAPPVPAAAPVDPAPMAVPVADERDERRPRRRPDDEERAARRRDFDDMPTQRWEFQDEDDMPARRPRRDDAPAPRQRRGADDRFDEPTGAMSRRALEEGLRRYEDEDEMPAPRARRRDDAYEDTASRSRRFAEAGFDDEPAPRPRARRVADEDDMPAPRRRVVDEDDMPAPRRRVVDEDMPMPMPATRGRRAEFVDDDVDMPAPRARRAEFVDDDVDMPAPRARRAEFVDDDMDMPAPRPRRYADEEAPAPRQRRYADDDRYEDPRYDEGPPRRRPARYEDEQPRPSRAGRFAEEAEDAPRARRDRGADVDRADSGRHSRSEFVDLAGDPRVAYDDQEADETPTLVDMAQRRARKASQQESVRTGTSRGARRGPRAGTVEEADDAGYWAQLRGEAQ